MFFVERVFFGQGKFVVVKFVVILQEFIFGDWVVEDIVMNGQFLFDLAGQYGIDFLEYVYFFSSNGQVFVYSLAGIEQ